MSAVKYAEDDIKYISTSKEKEIVAFLSSSRNYRLIFIAEGSLTCEINGAEFQYEDGNVVIIHEGTECAKVSSRSESIRAYAISFARGVYNDISVFFECKAFCDSLQKKGLASVKIRGIQKNKLEYEVAALNEISSESGSGHLRLMSAKLIYDCFIKRSEVPVWTKNPPDWFVEYYLLLSRHYVFTKSFGEIIALAGKSREYVSRVFKSSTGRNISEHIIDLRMNYACNLLKNSSMDVMEISFECGFENLSTFYHHFSKRMGMPPQSYRNRARLN